MTDLQPAPFGATTREEILSSRLEILDDGYFIDLRDATLNDEPVEFATSTRSRCEPAESPGGDGAATEMARTRAEDEPVVATGTVVEPNDLQRAPGSQAGVNWVDPEVLHALIGADLPEPGDLSRDPGIVVRVGMASLFLVNAIVALLKPEEFASLLTTNIVGKYLPESLVDVMVLGAGINDALIAAAILFFGHRKRVWVWAALWFLTIAAVKLSNLVF